MTRDEARKHVPARIRHFIGGEFVAAQSGGVFTDRDPHDNTVLTQVEAGSAEDVARAVAAAQQAYQRHWRRTPAQSRAASLRRIATL